MKKAILFILMTLMLCGVASAQQYLWRYQSHATDCTSLTSGKTRDLCYEVDSSTLYKCVPSAGDCDTAGEWKAIEDVVDTDTNTNASSECSGTTTYYDGEGNCDDISSVYEAAGVTESDISELDHTATAITDGLIIEPDISGDVAPTDGDFLQYDSTGTNFTWRSATELLSDLSPSAGTDITADLEEEAHCSEHDSTDIDCVGETIIVVDDSHAHTTTTLSGIVNADLSGSAGITGANILDDTIDSGDYAAGSIDFEHIAPDVIAGAADTTIADTDYVLFWDATDSALKKVDGAELTAGGAETNSLETVMTGALEHELPLGTSADTATYTALGDCDGATNALTYDTTTHAFGCNTIAGAAHDAVTVTDTSIIDLTLATQDIQGTVVADSLDFTELADSMTLDASTTIATGEHALTFQVNNPSSGAFDFNGSGAYTGDLIHIHQHTGNVGAGSLIHAESVDMDVDPLVLIHQDAADITADTVNLKLAATDDDDTNWIPMEVRDDVDTNNDLLFKISSTGQILSDSLTASEIVITDASKNIVSAAVATYPSLTELSYVKGLSSAVQTQINAQEAELTNSAGLLAALDDETGTGVAVFSTSPSLTTPSLGAATATSVTATSIVLSDGLIDGVGAVDIDVGSADVTDVTFVTDGGTVILDGTITAGGTDQSTFTEGLVVNDGGGADEDDDFTWESTSDAAALSCDAGDDTCTFQAAVTITGTFTPPADGITHADIADADQADTKCLYIEDPVDGDDLTSIWANKTANDFLITELWCESDQTVPFDLQIDDGTPADVNGTDVSCAAGEAEDTTLSGDTTLAAGEELDLVIGTTSGTPTWVSICWTGNWVD